MALRTPRSGPPPETASSLSIIAAGTTVVGDVRSTGTIKIEGRVEGGVRAAAYVLIAHGGIIEGSVSATQAVIAGEVRGDVCVSERLELKAGGVVHGDLTAPVVCVEEGGELNGRIQMGAHAPEEPRTLVAPEHEPAFSLA